MRPTVCWMRPTDCWLHLVYWLRAHYQQRPSAISLIYYVDTNTSHSSTTLGSFFKPYFSRLLSLCFYNIHNSRRSFPKPHHYVSYARLYALLHLQAQIFDLITHSASTWQAVVQPPWCESCWVCQQGSGKKTGRGKSSRQCTKEWTRIQMIVSSLTNLLLLQKHWLTRLDPL